GREFHFDQLTLAGVADAAAHAVALVAGIAGDVELAGEHLAGRGRDLEMDVRRAADVSHWLQRAEAVAAVGLDQQATIALERRIALVAPGLAGGVVDCLGIRTAR